MKNIKTYIIRPAAFLMLYAAGASIGSSVLLVAYQIFVKGGRPPDEFGWTLGLAVSLWLVLIRFGIVNLPAIVALSLFPRFRQRLTFAFPLIAGVMVSIVPWPFCVLVRHLTGGAFNPNLSTLWHCIPFNLAALTALLATLAVHLLATRRPQKKE
jgi:hypothetical protein